MKVNTLIVDTVCFIRNIKIEDLTEHVITVDDAVKEIRDNETRERLKILPYELVIKEPDPEAVKHVSNFAKKTGDFLSLSVTDLKLLALTYTIEKEKNGEEHLRTQPPDNTKIKTSTKFKNPVDIAGFYLENNNNKSEIKKDLNINNNNIKEDDKPSNIKLDHSLSDDNDDSDDGWITPKNITSISNKFDEMTAVDKTTIDVACLTNDFSMQNVLLQMGLNVLSESGMLIKKTKNYVFRCFACYKITKKMDAIFCPNCGNKDTLKKVCMTIDKNGKMQLFLSKSKPISKKGLKYSLPTPKGGKHAKNPFLFEDQPFPHQRGSKASKKKMDVLNDDLLATSNSPFSVNDVYSRAAQLGIRSGNRFKRAQISKRH